MSAQHHLQRPALLLCRLPAVTMNVGDSLFIDWDEPIHLVAVYDLTNPYKRLPIVPYPPQPIYKCPNCEYCQAVDGISCLPAARSAAVAGGAVRVDVGGVQQGQCRRV
jgi:hypothetical protein